MKRKHVYSYVFRGISYRNFVEAKREAYDLLVKNQCGKLSKIDENGEIHAEYRLIRTEGRLICRLLYEKKSKEKQLCLEYLF